MFVWQLLLFLLDEEYSALPEYFNPYSFLIYIESIRGFPTGNWQPNFKLILRHGYMTDQKYQRGLVPTSKGRTRQRERKQVKSDI